MTRAEEGLDTTATRLAKYQSSGRALLARFLGADIVETEADGGWVDTDTGRRFFDAGSFSIFLLGHRRREIVQAVAAQLERLPGASRVLLNAQNVDAVGALVEAFGPPFQKGMLLNSGAEAVEAALKLGRIHTGRSGIAHLAGSFHGKTFGALSVTDSATLKVNVGPLLPDVLRLPRDDPKACHAQILAAKPAAVIFEPVQGEGGAFDVGAAMARALRAACDEVGTVLICDEIQCGLGRCGPLSVAVSYGISPDILLLGKPLGGGVMPVSALLATAKVFSPYDRDPLLHTSTFGGNPLACAALMATLEVIRSERLETLVAHSGGVLEAMLEALVGRHPLILAAARGKGLLRGLVFRNAAFAGEFVKAAIREGILVTPCMTSPEVIRITPNAFVRDDELDGMRQAFERALAAIADEYGLGRDPTEDRPEGL